MTITQPRFCQVFYLQDHQVDMLSLPHTSLIHSKCRRNVLEFNYTSGKASLINCSKSEIYFACF